jgi:transposase-like protein
MSKKNSRKRYTDKEIAKAITFMENNINPHTGNPNYSKVSKELDINRKTLMRWWSDRHSEDAEQIRTLKRQEFIEAAWNEINEGLKVLAVKRGRATYKEIITSLGILLDKIQMLKGEPTLITKNDNRTELYDKYKHLSEKELRKEIEKLNKIVEESNNAKSGS